MRLAMPHLPWKSKDPYWDAFINKAPSDANNLVPTAIRDATEGQVFPVKADTHTPEVMAEHIKEMGRFFGADLVGIARSNSHDQEGYPFAIVCVIRSEYDPRVSPGIGGQAAALTGAYVTFNLAAAIREFGYRATRVSEADLDGLAAHAELGSLDVDGRLITKDFGKRVHVADAILTDLPLRADGEEA
jgi:hypothetical protein